MQLDPDHLRQPPFWNKVYSADENCDVPQAFLPEARKTSTTARTSFENVTSRINLQLTLPNFNCLSGLGKKKKKNVFKWSRCPHNYRTGHFTSMTLSVLLLRLKINFFWVSFRRPHRGCIISLFIAEKVLYTWNLIGYAWFFVTSLNPSGKLGPGWEGGRHLGIHYGINSIQVVRRVHAPVCCPFIPCLPFQFALLVLRLFEWSLDHILSDILCNQRIPRASNKFSLPSSCFVRVSSWCGMPKSPITCGPLPYSQL